MKQALQLARGEETRAAIGGRSPDSAPQGHRAQAVEDAEEQPVARHTPGFLQCCLGRIQKLEHSDQGDDIEGSLAERETSGVTQEKRDVGPAVSGEAQHGRSPVEPDPR
jgi:hypothetical protein